MISFSLGKQLDSASGPLQLQVEASIAGGSFATLFGPSGAGKTTVLRMLAGLARPDSGRIVVNGETWFDAARGIHLPPQHRAIGFVFQDYALFPNLSVRENIAYAVERHEGGWVDELIALMDLGKLQERLPATLSGGQKQRVALARALARKPKLLLLDEPLSALDLNLRQQLQDELAALHRRFGLTTLMVSHELGEVFKMSDAVLRLEAGRIAASGTPREVFLQGRLSGRLNLHAQVLDIRREDVVHIVTLLIGQEVIDVVASEDEVAALRSGDNVSVSARAISPYLSPAGSR
ncbi:ABC transporter ATP-binding protein [Noviherbaspirillum sp.]|uniref:ABC transporter ATP-binding protein n=1 Tax=Noviherbaspirillum sp. TaxID=1926288 RepID=UPI002D60C708|nr:ATP-binding cassette domain-containing protein [Noviherbaspirillum sp.]HZW21937.1 ATP-binding cassette domain-containing protein [Noviherbaspirillum sp.]